MAVVCGSSGWWARFKPIPFGLPANAVSLRVLNAGGVAGDTNAHRQAKLEAFLVGQPELSC